MTLQSAQDQVSKYSYEIAGFMASAGGSSFKFREFFEKGVEVAIFAFITGLFGAFAAHLYKIIVNKLTTKKDETKSSKSV